MKIRCLGLFAATALALSSVQSPATGQELVVQPGRRAASPYHSPYQAGVYSPYPGIWAPVPYPNWNYPPHWIWSYMRPDVPGDRNGDSLGSGRTYRGRDTLDPAVPYSDYLRGQKDVLKGRDDAKPGAAANKAVLEIRMPTETAKLFFDGKEATGDGETRTFSTPVLAPGQTYQFTLKAAWPGLINDLTNEQTVSFQAGDHKKIDLRPKN
jgi:uncharacterized protein (TIGR03000 family)